MAGFFEFSMMRVRDDIDQKLLAELFYQYLNVEEDFIKDAVHRGRDPARADLRRTRPSLPIDGALEVLDYERASRGRRERRAHRRRPLLLPPQDGAPGPRLRRADEHLHDLQQHRRLADPARPRPARSTRPSASICSPRPANAVWSSSARTSSSGSTSSATAAAAAARR